MIIKIIIIHYNLRLSNTRCEFSHKRSIQNIIERVKICLNKKKKIHLREILVKHCIDI